MELQKTPVIHSARRRTASVLQKPLPPRKLKAEGFVELMARTNFSFLQGASFPEEMVEQAVKLDYDGIGICDLNGLYGVARGFQAATAPSLLTASVNVKENFRYLVGTEIVLVDETSLVLMPMNKEGYGKLCDLLTLGKRQAAKGFSKLRWEDVKERSENILCFSTPPWSEEIFLKLQESFEDRLYLPVWRDLTWESREFFRKALALESRYGARLFATNRPLMHVPERKPLFDVVTCILHGRTIDNAKDILIQNGERHLRPLPELEDVWKDRLDLLEATLDIAGRVEFSLDQIRYRYPSSNLPQGLEAHEYLRQLVYDGLGERYYHDIPENVRKVTEHELKIIRELEYEDYFLTLYEICRFARSRDILYQGRGSAANSVVCFALGLTAIDPVKMGLLFERFISLERNEPPDIDIDFEHERREEVIQHIYEKYGEKHAAMVCTVIRYRSRMAFREAAKVFGVPQSKVNSMIKFMGRDGMKRLTEKGVAGKFGVPSETLQVVLEAASGLYGFPRHLGIHTGGFLITQNPIAEMVPVEKATMNGRYVIQWNKDDVNVLKLMKIDILSLGMLTVLKKCFHLLKKQKNLSYELYRLPQECPKTYDMICRSDTVGVFQIESRAQMNTLQRLKPKTFYDLVVEIAIVRPGPLQGGMVHPYLRRRQGLENVVYPHEALEPILGKTLGVPIFQEQVMKMVVAVAGFSPGEADELRRMMSNAWRKKGSLKSIQGRVLRGMKQHGIEEKYAIQIYRTIEGFANYGFPESHAASFALLTYASSYLKCHHPDVFACALLNSQPMGFYPPRVIINDAQRHQVRFRPLDIQRSQCDYTLEEEPDSIWGHAVRTGLKSIYGIPEKHLKHIESERSQNGPYVHFQDLIRRTRVPKSVLLKLAAAGAFQCFGENVRKIIWEIESMALDPNSFLWGERRESFAVEETERDSESQLLPFESNWDVLRRETETKGFSIEAHPMKVLRPWIERRNEAARKRKLIPFSDSKALKKMKSPRKVRVSGFVSLTQRPPTAKGMCFITLEDEFGFINIVVPPPIYQRDRVAIYSSSFLDVCGTLEISGSVKAERVMSSPFETRRGAEKEDAPEKT